MDGMNELIQGPCKNTKRKPLFTFPALTVFGTGGFLLAQVVGAIWLLGHRLRRNGSNETHNCVVQRLRSCHAELSPLVLEQPWIYLIGQSLHFNASVLKESKLGLKARRQLNPTKPAFSVPPLFWGLPKKPNCILAVDGRDKLWEKMMQGL